MFFLILFSTGTYAGIGTKCVHSESTKKSVVSSFLIHPLDFAIKGQAMLMPFMYNSLFQMPIADIFSTPCYILRITSGAVETLDENWSTLVFAYFTHLLAEFP